jgi:hypothetical protein
MAEVKIFVVPLPPSEVRENKHASTLVEVRIWRLGVSESMGEKRLLSGDSR